MLVTCASFILRSKCKKQGNVILKSRIYCIWNIATWLCCHSFGMWSAVPQLWIRHHEQDKRAQYWELVQHHWVVKQTRLPDQSECILVHVAWAEGHEYWEIWFRITVKVLVFHIQSCQIRVTIDKTSYSKPFILAVIWSLKYPCTIAHVLISRPLHVFGLFICTFVLKCTHGYTLRF